jgi:PucR C-terminal helix-turn-helix domain/GGDEF-like domain
MAAMNESKTPMRQPPPRDPGPPEPTGDAGVVLGRLCAVVADELPALMTGIVEAIRAEIPQYVAVPMLEHQRQLETQLGNLLAGLAELRQPGQSDLEDARQLGRSRAEEGVPIEFVIGGYQIGYRELWNVLLARAAAGPERGLSELLLARVELLLTWIRLTTGVTADAYAVLLRARQTAQDALRRRFMEVLETGDPASETSASLARALGFDPQSSFQAVCTPTADWSEEHRDALQIAFASFNGVAQCLPWHWQRQDLIAILYQNASTNSVLAEIERLDSEVPLGIGLLRPSLTGARLTILDAAQALAVAPRGGTVSFEDEWLLASLHQQRDRLTPLLGEAADTARAYPHLAEAVLAYGKHGFSIAASAKDLYLHPNTVTYRLDRWQQLTGWNPRSLDGLLNSVVGLNLYRTGTSNTEASGEPDD